MNVQPALTAAVTVAPTTAEGILAVLEDPATPGKIDAGYMPPKVEFEEIVLTEFGASIPPAGAIGLRNGTLALGNGATAGGVSASPRTFRGQKILTYDGPNTGQVKTLMSFPITESESSTAGQRRLKISGTVDIMLIGGSVNVSNIFLGVALESNETSLHDAAAPSGWLSIDVHPTPGTNGSVKAIRFVSGIRPVLFSNTPGTISLDIDSTVAEAWCHIYGDGTDNVTTCPVPSDSPFYPEVTGDVTQNIYVVIEARGQTAGTLLLSYVVNYDLNIEFEELP